MASNLADARKEGARARSSSQRAACTYCSNVIPQGIVIFALFDLIGIILDVCLFVRLWLIF
jgi:hypothetical protein